MKVWHFGECMNGIKAALTLAAPIFKSKLDSGQFKEAKKLYREHFPDSEGLRHCVAHHANLTESIATTKANAIQGRLDKFGIQVGDGSTMLKANLFDSTLVYSHKGNIRRLDITKETVMKLVAVRDKFYAAFKPVMHQWGV